ncbi:SDR family NAD(P)-dependent oxidoreductase [Baekduia sp. Peel2402]|uniref:SDR family NAD(P)-dependent oxidoreductase n=1 Tax=Baekduia sp. Peel2402 TaxID=3458296 RepID=UPI00403E52D8
MSRVAIVTGAAGGVGSATCDVLEAQGWTVVPVDRRPVDRDGAQQIDLADAPYVMEKLGQYERVDLLVNNAALQLFKPLEDTSLAEWDAVHHVNLRGAFACLKACRDGLIATGGSVVNVASVHALATSKSISTYAASKGGLVAFTRAASLELAPHGVRVNAVVPGAVDTPALREGFARRENAEAALVASTPLRRIGRPEEIAEAIAFLADNDRAGFITGQALVIDGGAMAALSTE